MKYILTESQISKLIESQEYLNSLLDKINQKGYESLNDREKDALVRISKGEEVYDEPQELPVSDEVYRPNDIFLKYVSNYVELEVGNQTFRIEPMGGTSSVEILGDYHSFLVEPNFETSEVLIYDSETDEVESVKYKNIPQTTEGMRNLVTKFVFQILPKYIEEKLN